MRVGAEIVHSYFFKGHEMVVAKVLPARSDAAAGTDRSSLIAVLMFSAIGLLISLSVILLDQYIPGEWF